MTCRQNQGLDGRLGQLGAAEVGVENGAGRVDDADQAVLAVMAHAPLDPGENVVPSSSARGNEAPSEICRRKSATISRHSRATYSRSTLASQAAARACESSRSTDGRSLSEALACVMLDEAGTVDAGIQPPLAV
jgi:hypothetical protein